MTLDEFLELLGIVRPKAETLFNEAPELFGGKLRYSMDGASYHNGVEEYSVLPAGSIHRPPARSPDLHKPPEASIRRVKAAFRKAFTHDRRVCTPEQARRLLQKIAAEKLTPEYVRNLISKMNKTFASVVKKKGGWASRGCR